MYEESKVGLKDKVDNTWKGEILGWRIHGKRDITEERVKGIRKVKKAERIRWIILYMERRDSTEERVKGTEESKEGVKDKVDNMYIERRE